MILRHWLPRAFWLAAWSLWLWLGFGLHRELPRGQGERIGAIPVTGDVLIGFVGDTDLVAVQRFERQPPTSKPARVEVFDALSGDLLHDVPLHRGFNPNVGDRLSARWGVILRGAKRPEDKASTVSERGLYALDLRIGEWREFVKEGVDNWAVHPHKPWVVWTQWLPTNERFRVTAADLRTGEVLCSHRIPYVGGSVASIVFIPERDEFALRAGYSGGIQVEVWPIVGDGKGVKTGIDLDLFEDLSASRNGRIVLHQTPGPGSTDSSKPDVVDFVERRRLSSISASDRGKDPSAKSFRPVISPNGQAVLRGNPAALHRVGDGAAIWQLQPHESIVGADPLLHRPLPWEAAFNVQEDWQSFLPNWATKLDYRTVARRSLDDGSFLFRTWSGFFVTPENVNRTGTLMVNDDGAVHRNPLSVNYPLLALCQTILALPLILLWALLLWRRNRRLRFASDSRQFINTGAAAT